MRLLAPLHRLAARLRRPARPADPFRDFTARDWSDLPPFHPERDPDWPAR